MEVHAHTHTERKKWTHYFWEFFMLFLAVFFGFLAELRVEHTIEHSREKNFMKTLLVDLRADILALDSNENKRNLREQQLDTLFNLLEQKDLQKNAKEIYRLADASDGYETFIRNDRTIVQLKFAAGMRLIRKNIVSEKIMDFDNYINSETSSNNEAEADRISYYKEIRFRLFDGWCYSRYSSGDTITPVYFLPVGKNVVNEVAGAIFQVKRISATNRETGQTVKTRAVDLINLIEKEYHIK
jgi:hypothetical protein